MEYTNIQEKKKKTIKRKNTLAFFILSMLNSTWFGFFLSNALIKYLGLVSRQDEEEKVGEIIISRY